MAYYRAMHEMQSVVLPSYVVCLSVRLSVRDVGDLWSYRVNYFESNYMNNYLRVFALQSLNVANLIPEEHPPNLVEYG